MEYSYYRPSKIDGGEITSPNIIFSFCFWLDDYSSEQKLTPLELHGKCSFCRTLKLGAFHRAGLPGRKTILGFSVVYDFSQRVTLTTATNQGQVAVIPAGEQAKRLHSQIFIVAVAGWWNPGMISANLQLWFGISMNRKILLLWRTPMHAPSPPFQVF